MIRIGNVELRNLQEQVLQNQQDIKFILEEQGVLNQFGIKVVGQIADASLLPDASTYIGEYGDAFAVGTETPYDLYVWTRAFSGQPNPFWFNIGAFPQPSTVPGPQGETGETGATGTRGSTWQSSRSAPTTGSNLPGDQALNTNTGDVYQWNGSTWELVGNIKGPQGIQGIQGNPGEQGIQGPEGPPGPQGDVGGFINIVGIVSSTAQLPDPAQVGNLTKAYLVGAAEPYNLYIQIGESSASAIWTDVGPLNAATLVQAEGKYVGLWDADVKLDKQTNPKTIYSVNENGEQATLNYGTEEDSDIIIQRDENGTLSVPTPTTDSDAVPKSYVDGVAASIESNIDAIKNNFLPTTRKANQVYVTNGNGTQTTVTYDQAATGGAIPLRQANGNITVPATPSAQTDGASKAYIDSKSRYLHNITLTDANKYNVLVFQIFTDKPTPYTTFPEVLQILIKAGYIINSNYYKSATGQIAARSGDYLNRPISYFQVDSRGFFITYIEFPSHDRETISPQLDQVFDIVES